MSLFAFVELVDADWPYESSPNEGWGPVVWRMCDAGAYLVSAPTLKPDGVLEMIKDATGVENVGYNVFLIASSPVALHWQEWQERFQNSKRDEQFRMAAAMSSALNALAVFVGARSFRAYFSDIYLDPKEIVRQSTTIGSLPELIQEIAGTLDLHDPTRCVTVQVGDSRP